MWYKKLQLTVWSLAFVALVSCDNLIVDNSVSPKTSTINIFNSSGSSVSATIYYGDKQKTQTLNTGSSTFTFESTSTTPCMIHYDGRYASYGSTGTFNIPYGETYPVILNANIGWIQLRSYTQIDNPKYGSTSFMWDTNGNSLSVDDSYSLLPSEDQYCRITSAGNDYIRFRFPGRIKTTRLSSRTSCSLGTTQLVVITSLTSVVEE